MKKLLFIDRDGTILREPADEQVDSFEKMEFLPFCIQSLTKIARETDYELVMVTNQDGLGTATFPEQDFWPVHNLMLKILASEGVSFANIHIDPSTPDAPSPGRKPGIAMLERYFGDGYDLSQSYVIGDRTSDLELAQNLGCACILISDKAAKGSELATTDWSEIASFLINKPRKTKVKRKTRETEIDLELNLDGCGKADIQTGIGFFDHMLEQIAKHGNMNLFITCKGDLNVDEHHTIEDVGLALGKAFANALESKKGIERYGFTIPMDDCEARVNIDFGGRPFFIWKADFKREKIGEMPCELFDHFFKSFSDNARCNLQIEAFGQNEHHKIEAIFKAFARALKSAVKKTGDAQIPSTKGSL